MINELTYPASLLGDPLRDFLGEDKLDDEADDVGEESPDTSLDHCDRHAVTEAEQRDDATPVNVTVTK